MIDLGRGREGAFLGGNKETLCEGERDENCSHAPCLSSVCIRIHIISSAADNLLKADPLSCQNDTASTKLGKSVTAHSASKINTFILHHRH